MVVIGKRVDRNQRDITSALRQVGASVQPIHVIGRGCPDLAVGYKYRNYFLELKVGKARLTEDEQRWHWDWRGQVAVVRSVHEAMVAIGAVEEEKA